jgi:hypothetical protein
MIDDVAAAHARRDFVLSNYVEVAGPLETPCWEWQRYRDRDGYGTVWYKGSQSQHKAHRLAWIIHNGPIPEYLHCLHRCDNPPCLNHEHLFLGTAADNAADRDAKGRHHFGTGGSTGCSPPNRILSNAEVANIKGLLLRYSWVGLQSEIARRYGIHRNTVCDIAHGRHRADITPSDNPIMPPNPDPPIPRRSL